MRTARPRVIWIVDDSALDAERVRRIFAPDHTVRLFTDGSAVLEALTSDERPDVLILDWIMPGISGVEVCRFLRTGLTRTQDIAILLLTARRHTEQIVEGLNAGANDYVAKPYADEELVARVNALLRTIDLIERAERAEAENRRLLEHAPDPLLVVDADGKLCLVNEAAVRVFDMSSEHLVGMSLVELLPGLDVALAHVEGQPVDVEIAGRLFSPSWRLVPEGDGRTAILLHDVSRRRRVDEQRLDVAIREFATLEPPP
jgi:PAS domain S-box-containing protein